MHVLTALCLHVQWATEFTQLDVNIRGSVKRVQLDNQMLDATQPVVLAAATAAHAHSETAASLQASSSFCDSRQLVLQSGPGP